MSNVNNNTPKLTKMPSNAMIRKDHLSLVNFINSYYIYRDIKRCAGVRKILIIGPGQGLDTEILKCKGFDNAFSPDVLGNIHRLDMFEDKQFDLIVAPHVFLIYLIIFTNRMELLLNIVKDSTFRKWG